MIYMTGLAPELGHSKIVWICHEVRSYLMKVGDNCQLLGFDTAGHFRL